MANQSASGAVVNPANAILPPAPPSISYAHRKRAEASDPNTPPNALLPLAELFTTEVLANPILPLLSLEDPALYQRILHRAYYGLSYQGIRVPQAGIAVAEQMAADFALAELTALLPSLRADSNDIAILIQWLQQKQAGKKPIWSHLMRLVLYTRSLRGHALEGLMVTWLRTRSLHVTNRRHVVNDLLRMSSKQSFDRIGYDVWFQLYTKHQPQLQKWHEEYITHLQQECARMTIRPSKR